MNNPHHLSSILNHLAGTAIYVIRQDNHQILYYNDKVKEVTPHIEAGMVCDRLWEGSCNNCPLLTMGDKESNTTTNFEDPFGQMVDISATRMMWDDLPAFLIAVSQHVVTVTERRLSLENQQMAIALTMAYPMVISVNLTQNNYYMVEYDRFDTKKAPESGVFDELIKIGTATIHPDFRQRFHDTFNRQKLLQAFSEGTRDIYMEHRQLGDDGQYHWTTTHVLKADNPYNDDVLEITLSKNIDQQKQNEEVLKHSLDAACRNSGGIVGKFLVMDEHVRLLEASDQFHEFFGLSMEHYQKHDVFSTFPQEAANEYIQKICTVGKHRGNINLELQYVNFKGENFWLQFQAACIGEQAGWPIYFTLIVDITSHKQLELDREATYDSLPGGIAKVAIDDDFTLVEANETLFELCQLSPDDFADGYLPLIHEADRKRVASSVRAQAKHDLPVKLEYRLKTKTGKLIWVHVEGRKVGLWHGYPLYLTVVIDITERKKAEDELSQEQLRYRIAIEASAELLFEYVVPEDTFHIYRNVKGVPVDERTMKETLPRFTERLSEYGFVHPEDEGELRGLLDGKLSHCEIRLMGKGRYYQPTKPGESEYGWFSFQGDTIRDQGSISRVIGTVRDIDKFKKTEDDSIYFQKICNFISNKDYELLGTIDVRSREYHVAYTASDSVYVDSPMDGPYEEKILSFTRRFVTSEDRRRVADMFRLETVQQQLQSNGKEYSVYYQGLEKEGSSRWKSMSFSYYSEDKGKILISIRDIQEIQDAKVKEEIADRSLSIALDSIYEEVIYLNLSKWQFVFVRSRGNYALPSRLEEDSLETVLLPSIHPADREEVALKLGQKHLLDALARGESSIYLESRRMGKDRRYHWTALNIIRMDDTPDGDIMVMLLLSTIDERKQIEQEHEEFYTGVTELFEECVSLNATKNTYILRRISDRSWEKIPEQGDFDTNNRLYCRTLIHPDDQQLFLDAFSLSSIRKEMGENGAGRIHCEFRRKITSGEYHWAEMTAIRVDDMFGDDLKVILVYRDIHDLRLAQEQQRDADQRFAVTVNTLYNTIYEAELNSGVFYKWRYDGYKLTREQLAQPIGDTLEEVSEHIVHPDYKEDYDRHFSLEALRSAFKEGRQEIYMEAPRLMEDGLYRWYSMQVQFLPQKVNEIHFMFYLKDLDDAKRESEAKRQALLDALNLAKQANSAKTDFLSRMSHDIRTPMNAIIGMTTIAEANLDDTAKIEDALGKINVSAKFLLSLINDILDMSKIESGKMQLSSKPFDIHEFLRDIATVTSAQALGKEQKFDMVMTDDVGREYVGDVLRLNQILLNLLGNAIKYTDRKGTVSLRVSLVEKGDATDTLRFEVEDNGIGISPEFLERMFDPFEQARPSSGRVFEGTGLGLSITKNLVQMMNGRLHVSSEVGKGSLFTVELPLETSRMKLPTSTSSVSLEGLSVLVVDDERFICEHLEQTLSRMGVVVRWTTSSYAAVKLVQEADQAHSLFDVVLLDWKMPEMDGLSTVRAIRRLVGTDTVIIVMSAYDWSEIESEARQAGVDMFLSKPVCADAVRPVLEQVCTWNGSSRREDRPDRTADLVFHHERILLVEDNEINMEIARTLLEMRGLVVDSAENGRLAVDVFSSSPPGYYQMVLMDIRMPVMDGIEATKAIRRLVRPDAKTVPIVAMTANAFQDEVDYAKRAGMTDYLTKPIDTNVLFRVLHRVLHA